MPARRAEMTGRSERLPTGETARLEGPAGFREPSANSQPGLCQVLLVKNDSPCCLHLQLRGETGKRSVRPYESLLLVEKRAIGGKRMLVDAMVTNPGPQMAQYEWALMIYESSSDADPDSTELTTSERVSSGLVA